MVPSVFPAPSPSDSGLRLESLARICMSLSRRPLPDAGWGAAGRDSFARFSSALFRAMSGKVASGDDLACRCRLAVSLHALMRETDCVADARRYADWEALAARVLDDCEASVSGLLPPCACLLLLDYYYAWTSAPDDDPLWQLLEETFGSWSASYSPSAGWKGLSLREALERVRVLNRYSYMYLDHRYDRLATEAFRRYTRLLLEDGRRVDPEEAGLLYDLSQEGNACPDDLRLREKLCGIIRLATLYAPADSDEFWYGLSYQFEFLS